MTFFQLEQPFFTNIRCFISYTQKCMKIGRNSAFCERRYNFQTNEKSVSKVDTTSAVLIIQTCIFWTVWEKNPRRALGSDRAGPGRVRPVSSRTSIVWSKTNIFCSTSHASKINIIGDIVLIEIPCDCGRNFSTASWLCVVRHKNSSCYHSEIASVPGCAKNKKARKICLRGRNRNRLRRRSGGF